VPENGALTRRQEAVLKLCEREEAGPYDDDMANEGLVYEQLWPLVRRPRLVLNALVDRGLVELDCWIDEEIGYAFKLTDDGRAVLTASGDLSPAGAAPTNQPGLSEPDTRKEP
jgi:hypothetical protein